MGKVALLVAEVLCTAACAHPPEERIAALKRRGISSDELSAELRTQEAKFALFRSYRRIDEIVEALEQGQAVAARTTYVAPLGSRQAIKCAEEGNVVCFCYGDSITCVERSR